MNDLLAQHNDSVPGLGVPLVDASNAFNSLNQPCCSHFLLILIGVGQFSLFMVLLNTCIAEWVLHRVTSYQCFCML